MTSFTRPQRRWKAQAEARRRPEQRWRGPATNRAEDYTIGVTQDEIERAIAGILRKREGGEKLTAREETILAYGYYAAREQRMLFKLPGRDEEE